MRALRLTLLWLLVLVALFGAGVGFGAALGGDFKEEIKPAQSERGGKSSD